MYKYDIVLKNGVIINPMLNVEEVMDVGILEGKIQALEHEINPDCAKKCFDIKNYYVIPGIIDLHIHSTNKISGKYAHKMLAKAGITTALDMSGPIDTFLNFARDYGAGLNLACLQYIRPGDSIENSNPNYTQLENLLNLSLAKGAIGLKILGGHFPLTTEATRRAIEVANRNKAYIAFHAGTLEKGSNIEGLLQAIQLTEGNNLHLAHINSYCRGLIKPYMIETEIALKALEKHPNIKTESYLSPINGTSGKCSYGKPESLATRTWLVKGGYVPDEKGLEIAIKEGWAQVNMEKDDKIVLISGIEAVEYWREQDTETMVSFSVNPPEPRIRLVTAKNKANKFIIDCLSTDGGDIPRNVILEMGLSLVKLKALSLQEFVFKTSFLPAKILGLKNKGQISLGADADITVIDLEKQRAFMSFVNGKLIMLDGKIYGSGSQIITTDIGQKYVNKKGLNTIIVDLKKSIFYQRN